MDNMTFGKYIPGNSIIHRLDPRLKICAVFIFLISVFFDAGFIGYGILAIYVLLCSLVSKIKLSHILKAIKPMVFMMLFLIRFNHIENVENYLAGVRDNFKGMIYLSGNSKLINQLTMDDKMSWLFDVDSLLKIENDIKI